MSSSVLPRTRSILVKSSQYLALMGAVLARIARAQQHKRAVATLHQLSDYQLRDIGISRSEIVRSVDKGRLDF